MPPEAEHHDLAARLAELERFPEDVFADDLRSDSADRQVADSEEGFRGNLAQRPEPPTFERRDRRERRVLWIKHSLRALRCLRVIVKFFKDAD